jgi:hypothetical protein
MRFLGRTHNSVCCVLLCGILGIHLAAQARTDYQRSNHWPAIQPLKKVYRFSKADAAYLDLDIMGLEGEALYRLQCRTRENDDVVDFDFSGDFECRLTSTYSTDPYSNLLTENPDQSRDWESRARFFSEELQGDCAHYPEYGRVRTFRLRGMEITLKIDPIRFRKGRRTSDHREPLTSLLDAFGFTVSIRAAPQVRSAIAESAHFEQPPLLYPQCFGDLSRNCRQIVKRKAN